MAIASISASRTPQSETEQEKTIACENCGQKFHSNWNLKRHKQNSCKWEFKPSEKPNKSLPQLPCDKCGLSFTSNFNLRRHQTSSCTAALLNDDERRLALQRCAIKRYSCSDCKMKFANRNNFKCHQLICCPMANPKLVKNRSKAMMKCGDCGACFFKTFNLNRHRKLSCPAKKTVKHQFICDVCLLVFTSFQELEDHISTHETTE